MFIKKGSSTMKQMAYAQRLLGGQGVNKKQIALDSGYSPYVANSVSSHIESKAGFHNAMSKLALDSNNLALSAMHEFKARGFKDFTNKELVGALNAIGNAWSKFNAQPKEKGASESGNKLRTVVLQQIENQNNNITPSAESITPGTGVSKEAHDKPDSEVVDVADVDEPLDF